jgi:hypothetical protein
MYTTDYIPFLISIPKFNKTCKLAIKFSQTRMGNGMTAEWHVNDEFTIVNKGWFDIKFDVKLRELHLSVSCILKLIVLQMHVSLERECQGT